MINIKRFLSILILTIIQFFLLPRFNLGMFQPDLLLAFTILTGLFHGLEAGVLAGFFFGIITDVNTGVLLGARAIAWTQAGFAAAIIREKLVVDNWLVQTAIVAAGSGLAGMFHIVFQAMSGVTESLSYSALVLLTQSIMTALLTVPMIWFMRWLRWVPEQRL